MTRLLMELLLYCLLVALAMLSLQTGEEDFSLPWDVGADDRGGGGWHGGGGK